MRFRMGIMGQLTVGIVLTTLAGIGLIGIMAVKIVETSAVYSKVSEAERTARLFDHAMRRASVAGASGVERIASETLLEAGVMTYRLTRAAAARQGASEVIASRGAVERRDLAGSRLIPAPGGITARLVGGGLLSGPGDELVISAPLKAGSLAGGTLEFVVPLADIKEGMAGVRRFLLFYALIDSAIIIGFGVYFLSRSIVRPIRRLDATANRISGGTLGERAETGPDNEIGSLASSFNVMADRLESEITELERLNLQLVTTQKELLRSKTLAAVGGLAAGIAHEIGNPLGAVLGYLDILAGRVADTEEERDIVERAQREIGRIDSIVKEFLEVARPGRGAPAAVDVNAIIKDTYGALAVHDDMAGVEVTLDLAQSLPAVFMDEGKLRQVFINLLLNAAQAMAGGVGGRTIRVETAQGDAPEQETPRRRIDDTLAPGPAPADAGGRGVVVVTFTDNGPGITEADSEKIFEPFFTTKEVGRGTGLGLFMSRTIVKLYGGELDFTSTPAAGTSFRVTLPAGPAGQG